MSTPSRPELSAAGFNGKKARRIVADFDRMDDLPVDLSVENDEKAPREIILACAPLSAFAAVWKALAPI